MDIKNNFVISFSDSLLQSEGLFENTYLRHIMIVNTTIIIILTSLSKHVIDATAVLISIKSLNDSKSLFCAYKILILTIIREVQLAYTLVFFLVILCKSVKLLLRTSS